MLAVFGIENTGLNLAANLLLLSLVVIHFSLAFWTLSDARRRVDDSLMTACAVAGALLFPLVGPLVYAIIRPPEFLEDIRERELEMQAAEARLHQLSYLACPHCSYEVKEDWLRCPSCTKKLREPCSACAKPLDPEWRLCPHCETRVRGSQASNRRRRTAAAEQVDETHSSTSEHAALDVE